MSSTSVLGHIDCSLRVADHSTVYESGPDFGKLWASIESALAGTSLTQGDEVGIKFADGGRATLRVLGVEGSGAVGERTTFAVYGVSQRYDIRYKCDSCARSAQAETYGPHTCAGCGTKDKPGRVCDQHVSMLDGSLRTTCKEHHPACTACGVLSTFWCDGPVCGSDGGVAWCSAHRLEHPGDDSIGYCASCFDHLFPSCSAAKCQKTGSVRCEFVTEEGSCDRPICTQHARTWQIYGPHRDGLGLCTQHADLSKLSPEQVLLQMVAGTLHREKRSSGRRSQRDSRRRNLVSQGGWASTRLPSYGSYKHILMNSTKLIYDQASLRSLVDELRKIDPIRVRLSHEVWKKKGLDELDKQLSRGRKSEGDNKVAGEEVFGRFVGILAAHGDPYVRALVTQVRFADYKPARSDRSRPALLFIHLPSSSRGTLIGTLGSTIKPIQQQIEAQIKFEELQRAGGA